MTQKATCATCAHGIVTVDMGPGAPRTFWAHELDPVFYRDTPHEAIPEEGTQHEAPVTDPRRVDGQPGSF
jgi:hypothetical protein